MFLAINMKQIKNLSLLDNGVLVLVIACLCLIHGLWQPNYDWSTKNYLAPNGPLGIRKDINESSDLTFSRLYINCLSMNIFALNLSIIEVA